MNSRRWAVGKASAAIGVGAAILVGAVIRVWRIGELSLWFDEGYTAWLVRHPAGEIIRLVRADTAPPLYYLLLHGWTHQFGDSEAALRSLSALFGILTIALVAAIAARLSINRAAAAWICALSWWQVAYSQEARSYEMGVFFFALMLYGTVRHLEKPGWKWLSLLVSAGAAGLYTNNFMPLYILSIGVAALILPGAMNLRRRLRDVSIVTASLVAIYLPWIGSLGSQIARVQREFWIPKPTGLTICQELARVIGIEHFWTWDQYLHWLLTDTARDVPILGAVVLIAIVAAMMFGKHRRTAIGLSIAALLPLLVAAVYSLGPRSIFLPAAFVPSSVAMCVLIAGSRRWIVCVMLILVAVNLPAFEHERSKEDWRAAARTVAEMPPVQPRLIVFVANEGELPFDYYYGRRNGVRETGAPAGFFDVDPPVTQRRVGSEGDLLYVRVHMALARYGDVVLVEAHTDYSDPKELTSAFLHSALRPERRVDLPQGITIWRFVPR